ncbi:MAG: hypothetical protein JNK23_21470 [Opitutaceae bacterium]|nr:hypothetical protein [Opitutaceae bacterium]
MKLPVCYARLLVWTWAAVFAFTGLGCITALMPKHRVLVDAIAAPGVTKPSGMSYRLVAKKSVVAQSQMQVAAVKACIDAGLVGVGMFEAPATAAPDLFIEVSFGTYTGGRVDPSARETFLQLSARDNPTKGINSGTGRELWDVRVAVFGVAGAVESVMPLLSAVAAQNVASDSRYETKIEVPKNSPVVKAVRETAVKALEEQAPTPQAGATGKPAAALPPLVR